MSGRRAKLRMLWVDLAVLIVYIVLSLAMSYPLPLHMSTHTAGRYRDSRIFRWNNWWVKQAILTGQNPNHTDYIFYPSGVSLSSHNVNWVSSFLSVPLDLLFGPTVTYNLLFLLTLYGPAFGMYLLAHHLTGSRRAAFVAGLVFAFFPYHISGNWDGQMNLANIQWLPLCVLFVLRTVAHQRVWDALLSGVTFALASLDCWFFMIFLAMWGGVFLIYSLLFERRRWTWRLVGFFALAGGVSAILMAPFLLPVIVDSMSGTVDSALGYYVDAKASDLVAFVTPSLIHPLFGKLLAPFYAGLQHWRPAFVGYSVLALAILGVFAARRRSLLWVVSGLLFFVLALGTHPIIAGIEYPRIILPYGWLIRFLPAFKIVSQASRFNVMVALSLAVMVGLGCFGVLAWLERRLAPRPGAWRQGYAVSLFSVLILFEYLAIPCELTAEGFSPFYHQLAREPDDFAILELPLDGYYARLAMYPQTLHHKRLLSGRVARVPPEAYAFIRSNPVLKRLEIQMEVDPRLRDVPAELGLLAANNIRYVVIQKSAKPPVLDSEVLASWRALFGQAPIYEDQDVIAYRLDLAPGYSTVPLYRLGDRLGLMQVDARRTWMWPGGDQAITVDLTWKALDDLERDYACSLSLVGPTGAPIYTEAEIISPQLPTSRWAAGVVVADQYVVPIDSSLPAAEYVLSVMVMDVASGAELDKAEHIVQVEDNVSLLVPALEDMHAPVEVAFGKELRLLGSTIHQQGDRVAVDLYWQALRAMQTNYKVFVHLVRSADDAIVAQVDTMPRNWSYPTSKWARREVFVDRIELDVTGVAPGEYRLAVGVYDPASERLPAVDGEGRRLQDDRAILDEAVVLPLESR